MIHDVIPMKYSGNNTIDGQHEQLFKMVAEAREHVAKKAEFLGLLTLLGKLYDYASNHFHDEERIMRDNNYPDYDSHVRMHRVFVKQLDIYSAELTAKGEMDGKLLDFVERWLVAHVNAEAEEFKKNFK